MNSVLNIGDTIIYFTQLCNAFFSHTNAVIQITEKQSMQILHAIIDDEVNSRLKWCLPSKHLDDVLNEIFPWFDVSLNDPYSDKFNFEIIDAAMVYITGVIDKIIPTRTWHMYQCYKYGVDVYIVKGKDFRIHDWEQRIKSGEIQMDVKVNQKQLWLEERITPRHIKDNRFYDNGVKKPCKPKPFSMSVKFKPVSED